MNSKHLTRRQLLKAGLVVGAAGVLLPRDIARAAFEQAGVPQQIVIPPPRSEWVYELVAQRFEPTHVYFEYQVRDRIGGEIFLLNNHKAQIRSGHQRIQVDGSGQLMHVSGELVDPALLDDFIANSPDYYQWLTMPQDGSDWTATRGRSLTPYPFAKAPWAGGTTEYLDPQWLRETYQLSILNQVDTLISQYLDRASVRGWTGDKRGTTLNLQVGASADDARQIGSGANASLTDTFAWDVDANTDWGGLRWQNVTIPNSATIDSAVVQVDIPLDFIDEPFVDMDFENVDDASAFAATAGNLENRTLTGSPVAWSSTDLGADGTDPNFFTSPSLITPLQAVINRAGFSSGNSVVWIITQPSTMTLRDFACHSYDHNTSHAGKLDVDYTAAGAARRRILRTN